MRGMERANAARMIVELVSDVGGRISKINRKALAKLLHMAWLHGWRPERLAHELPSNTWETNVIMPHLEPYLPGYVSRSDAVELRKALTRAMATGDVAADGTVPFASMTLLQVAREGGFKVQENVVKFGQMRSVFSPTSA
jgi:hypothetical protein